MSWMSGFLFSGRPRGGAGCIAPLRGRPLNVLVAALLALAVGCSRQGTPETLWLGHISPLTGTDKPMGDRARQGISIAVDELNSKAEELILGRKVVVRHADAHSDSRAAEAEAVRLASVNRVVALLGGTDAVQAEQLARGAEAAGVPVVLQAAVPAPGDRAFSVVPSLGRRGNVLGKFASVEKKFGKVAIILEERFSAASPVADAFARELPKDAAPRFTYQKAEETASREAPKDGVPRPPIKNADDLPAAIAKAMAAKPEAVLFIGSAHEFPGLRSELRKSLPSAPVIFGGDDSGLSALQSDPSVGEDVYAATSYLPGDETAANQSFIKRYQEQFHEQPDVNAALAYDGTRLLAEAIRKAGTMNPVKVREALAETDGFESVTGALKFGKDHHAVRPLYVVQIKKGQAVLQKRYGGEE
jgi:branched-chain amino acid transport system substrate-binding protein